MGKQIRDLYKEGYDAVGTGNNYPYVLVSLVELEYLHNSSFEKTKAELEEKGCSYSNAVLIGITSLIRYDAGDKGKVIEYADKIDTSSQHLLGIINDVLDI